MIEYWVGVDGGGTHTRARIRNRAGKLLGEGRAAGSNLELGILHAHANVLAAIASARQAAGLGPECEQQMGVGLALASAELADCYHAMLAMPFPFASVKLTSDAFGACLGAFGGQEGAILIAGTGSAGLIYQGRQIRTCSGRGFPISDLGSGAWLGLRALQQSLLCHDGILPPSTLAVRLMDHFKRDQAQVVRWAARAIPAEYGHFAPWVFDAASDGDELACQLLDETCTQLAQLLDGMQQLGAHRIALLGGIGMRLAPRLARFNLATPKADALDGAILFAQSEEYPCLHP
ncbi:BadF/BadG/BcrA/BcrD ATPase family protein [Aeromonas enteropelogenes]|uniref:N-acetylglucosamine kinase n=1 Tax=Aeromonas enteropelogenes TaxID=29489 RepID=A0A175VM79_AEREN|nr:BadF/BadG/BcrA/BcrD ATPase family protein [Aeromonas enteropelogenes]KXU81741.1 N-acetylglucosamine kinase [Aeromonas enteropelogenes]MBL0520315.1 N-acetylglucosamine kinase [Aeromonas enteropelogenes]UAK73393.1 N-acetylglucosamine kinase [Aeromonas enteropelogenes]